MIGQSFIISALLVGSISAVPAFIKIGPHLHIGHQQEAAEVARRNAVLDAAAFAQNTINYVECQLAAGALAAVAALGLDKGSVSCSAPGSVATPAAALKPATIPVISNPVAAVAVAVTPAAAVNVVVTTVPIPLNMPNPTPTTPVNLVPVAVAAAPAAVSTGDPCVSTDPDVCTQQALALTAHNTARALHHVAPLLWSNTLATAASKWAENCVWKHSGGSLFPASYVYGENLYASTLDEPETSMTIAVSAFTNEEAFYNYSNPVYSDQSGHFTQVVWKDTQFVGCSIINCDLGIFEAYTNSSAFAVCTYYPSGNFQGEFAANVLAP